MTNDALKILNGFDDFKEAMQRKRLSSKAAFVAGYRFSQRDAHIVEYNTSIQAEVLKLLSEKDALTAENERLRAELEIANQPCAWCARQPMKGQP